MSIVVRDACVRCNDIDEDCSKELRKHRSSITMRFVFYGQMCEREMKYALRRMGLQNPV